MKKLLITICLLSLLSVCGCTFVDAYVDANNGYVKRDTKRRQQYVNSNPDLSVETKNYISNGKLHLGMTAKQVLASWGYPNRKNKSVGFWGVHEQWVYGNSLYSAIYLYFEEGILTSYQH